MASMQHTPGPWDHETKASPTRITGPKGQTVAAVYGGFVGSQEQASNARLIALAPALLDYVAAKAKEGDEQARALVAGPEPAD